MEPATRIIEALGGVAAVVAVTGVHRTRVWNWTQPKAKGGTGGLIPQKHIPALLALAQQKSVELNAGDFLPATDERAVA